MRNITKIIPVTLLFLTLLSVASQGQKAELSLDENQKWYVRMANSVMIRYPDNLTEMDIKFHHRSEPKWQYDIAMLAQVISYLEDYGEVYKDYMKDYIDFFINESGEINGYNPCDHNLDKINPGNDLIILYECTKEDKYKIAIEQLIKQLETQPHNPDGGFWHKSIYPHQMWLDGLYMSSPFMSRYAKTFNQPEWFDQVVKQITIVEEHTRDRGTGLLYHGYDASKGMKWSDDETGCSPHFWGRAMGWYMMAMVDVLDFFPDSHPGKEKIIEILKRTSESLIKVRDKNTGLWYQVLDKGGSPGNYIEASCSCMFTYAFAKAARKGYLDKKYLMIAEDSFNSILKEFIEIEADGQVSIKNCCFGAGLGGLDYRSGSYEYYINEKKGKNDSKSIAPFILAALELNK